MDIDVEELREHMEQEALIREKLRDEATNFEKTVRVLVASLNKIHSSPPTQVPEILLTVKPVLNSCRDHTAKLAECIPSQQYWRWKETWSKHLQSAVFAAALVHYLENGSLLSLPAANEILGIDPNWKDRLYLQVEDYLHGLITLINELSRLATNMVTFGDFEGPFRISAFVRDVFAGFSLLNLKNDILRRRFDSIKYDLKHIEEVVYDLSLRNLRPTTTAS